VVETQKKKWLEMHQNVEVRMEDGDA